MSTRPASPAYYRGGDLDAADIINQFGQNGEPMDYWTGSALAHILRAGKKSGESREEALTNALVCLQHALAHERTRGHAHVQESALPVPPVHQEQVTWLVARGFKQIEPGLWRSDLYKTDLRYNGEAWVDPDSSATEPQDGGSDWLTPWSYVEHRRSLPDPSDPEAPTRWRELLHCTR